MVTSSPLCRGACWRWGRGTGEGNVLNREGRGEQTRQTSARDARIPLPTLDFTGRERQLRRHKAQPTAMGGRGRWGQERNIRRKDKPLTSQSLKLPSLLLFPMACACASCRSSNEGQRSRISDKAPNSHRVSRRLSHMVVMKSGPGPTCHQGLCTLLCRLAFLLRQARGCSWVVKKEPYPERWPLPSATGVTSRLPEGPA